MTFDCDEFARVLKGERVITTVEEIDKFVNWYSYCPACRMHLAYGYKWLGKDGSRLGTGPGFAILLRKSFEKIHRESGRTFLEVDWSRLGELGEGRFS